MILGFFLKAQVWAAQSEHLLRAPRKNKSMERWVPGGTLVTSCESWDTWDLEILFVQPGTAEGELLREYVHHQHCSAEQRELFVQEAQRAEYPLPSLLHLH